MLRETWWRVRKKYTSAVCRRLPGGELHVGCGPVHLDGWINIDHRRYEAVDYIVDVRDGLPFRDLQYVFAEHFIEHLPYWEAERFLRDARAALRIGDVLRLSTPNLDWVYLTQYRIPHDSPEAIRDCFLLNGAFRAWGHQFLYNAETLSALLRSVGFVDVKPQIYGDSHHAALRNLERHPKSPESPALPHVLIFEASAGVCQEEPELETAATQYLQHLGAS